MKQKTLILYESKTGFTEQYARWISLELHAQTLPLKKVKVVHFEDYDTVIFGGGFHGGRINGLKSFLSLLPKLDGKTVVVFATGATPAESPSVEEALQQNFTDEQRKQIRVFYLQSGLCYEKMSLSSKLMMTVFRTMIKRTEGESETWKMLQHSYDFSSKKFIRPLVDYCRKETGKKKASL